MSSIPELAAQLDNELSNVSIDTDHLLTLLEQITNQVGTPEGCKELSDLVFDIVPTLILAAGQSKACEKAVERLLIAAAEKCIAREVYAALAAALSESMQTTANTAPEQEPSVGSSSLEFQNFLLQTATHSLLRIKKLSTSFLREHLLLATNWCQSCAQQKEQETCQGEHGFCKAMAPLIEAVTSREGLTEEERRNAKHVLSHSILCSSGSALELPWRLERATKAVQSKILEAQSTLTGKLLRFQSVLMQDLLSSGPEIILSLFHTAPFQFGIRNLEDVLEVREGKEEHPENEALGAATAVCSSILHSSAAENFSTENDGGGDDTQYLKYSNSTGKMLEYLSFTLNTLTDVAAQHQSVPLALLPLLTVAQYSRQLGVNETPLEESYVASSMPIITTLVAVMSLNHVEIVRTCAYEALHTFLDALVPQARYLVLQNMTTSSTSPVIVAVALQRLRLEISPAVLQPPFAHAAALQIMLPWIKRSTLPPPGWHSEEDVLHNADVLAAALSVLRFILLQRLAMCRKLPTGETQEETTGKREDGEGTASQIRDQLQPEKLKILINDHLKPLHACTVNIIQRMKTSLSLNEDSRSSEQQQHTAEVDMFLALQRLEEVLERTLEAAEELLEKS